MMFLPGGGPLAAASARALWGPVEDIVGFAPSPARLSPSGVYGNASFPDTE